MIAVLLLAAAVAVDPWSGRERHRAVVNSAVRVDDGRVLQLRGEWDFAKSNANSPGMFLKPWSHGQGKVKVPGCWEASGVGAPGVPPTYRCQDNSPKPLRHVWMGTGVYERTVKLPPAWTNAGQRVWLAAGGIAAQGWISVNDRWAGNDSPVGHYDSYCGTYRWDVTDLLRGGDEVRIRVLADNTVPCRGGGLYSSIRFGGIYRDIELQLTGDCWIEDAFVRCADGMRPVPEPHVELGGNTNGVKVALSYSSETFDWWSPERPNLYTCRIEVTRGGKLLDRRVERFGLKRLERRGKEFYLNGRPFFFRGFGDNHPYPVTGAPPADRAFHRAHLAKAKAAGFNYVRLHTHTEVPEYFEAADELGILVQPELPYYGNYGEDPFEFDPLRDAAERRDHCRRHVSYAIASGGNEGMFCDATAKALYRLQKETDPDRLVIEQDGCWPAENDAEGRSDFISGPLVPWKRGAFNQTPFICHEYLNLTVKSDSRDEAKYADTLWQPLLTREKRAEWLAKFGLGHDWGDRFQDSAHALQRMYQKMGLEWARMDPYCDGYCFWTIADTVVLNEKAGVFTAQGWLDPFWDVKRGAWTPEEFAVFNSPSAILLDLTDNPAAFPADQWDEKAWWGEGGLRPRPSKGCIFEDTNRVFTAGGAIDARFMLASYAERDLDAATLAWKLEGPSGVLARGEKALGRVTAGPPRTVLETRIPLPEVTRPVKARIAATVTGAPANAWDAWIFPKRTKRDGSRVFAAGRVRAALAGGFDNLCEDATKAKVVVGIAGSDELKAAAARGCDTVEFTNLDTPPNFKLGWWWLGQQAGTAIVKHPALGDFPCGPTLDPLFFRIVKEGAPLPFAGVSSGDLVIAGEGVDACYLYLAVAKHPSGARRIVVAGLDLLADCPEAAYLLDALVGYLLGDAAAESGGSTVLSGVSIVPPLISAAGVAGWFS